MADNQALEFLRPLDQLFMDQHHDAASVFLGASAKHKYRLINEHGQQVGAAAEDDSGLMERMFFGDSRGLTVRVFDNNGREAIKMVRPVSFIKDKIKIYNGNQLLGTVKQTVMSLSPEMLIYDAADNKILVISGPFMVNLMPSSTFTVKTAVQGREVGTIKKRWSHLSRELFSTSDIFGLTLPAGLDVKVKALLLGAAILIDFAYYEKN